MKQIQTTALFSLLLPLYLLANQQDHHIAVGIRQVTEEPAAEQDQPILNEEEGTEQTSGFLLDLFPPVYFSNSSHWLTAISIDQDKYSIQLEDGSQWNIQSHDSNKVLSWKTRDPLVITQNNRWFTKYNYLIINKNDGSKVEARLFLGPLEESTEARYIVSIDKDLSVISLDDHSHWEISYLDKSIFKNWLLDDYIIIGTNSNTSFWDSDKDAMLINVNMNNSVRAKQY